jgi:RNA polymerase sigma factor (sigma-70 family)
LASRYRDQQRDPEEALRLTLSSRSNKRRCDWTIRQHRNRPADEPCFITGNTVSDTTTQNTDAVMGTLLENHRRFLQFLESRVGNRHDAEEILQAAFVRSVEKTDQIRDSETAVAWFYRLLRNAIIDHYRRRDARNRSMEAYSKQAPAAVPVDDSDLERVVCACVNDLINNLKPEYAELIRRVDAEGVDVGAAAEALGITSGNARVRLHRARAALRDEVERSCRTCATHGCLDCTCSAKGCESAHA